MAWLGDGGEADIVRCWDKAIEKDALPSLKGEANLLWRSLGGSRDYAKTSWIGVRDAPRCGLERLALSILSFHFPHGTEARRAVLGAEFWTQLRESEAPAEQQGLSLHYDKDEAAVETWDIWSHPELGTATYLSGGGAPLLVYATRSPEDGEEDSMSESEEAPAPPPAPSSSSSSSSSSPPDQPPHGFVCFPSDARHVAFDGSLLHGVPEELLFLTAKGQDKKAAAHSRPYTRLSFLVNIWTSHRPEGVRRITDSLASKLQEAGRAAAKEATATGTKSKGKAKAKAKLPGVRGGLALKHKGSQRTAKFRDVTLQQPPGRCKKGHLVGNTKLYALKDHLKGDTGLIPADVLVKVRQEHAGRGSGGLLRITYRRPKKTIAKAKSKSKAKAKAKARASR
mmetsp:Transcript_77801/g.161630  ORF Transcript_77801/g.161630 Transcript_77801/m.161630 type:complete len:396 (+) Transcript_77801:115-1302(+)